MIRRIAYKKIIQALNRQAAVCILGPRQVGKTTLAFEIGKEYSSLYLDLESRTDRAKLLDPVLFLKTYEDKLVIFDEIHRIPKIFEELRGIIDERRRLKKNYGQFLILGSASIELLKQSSETLAGRIEYIELTPISIAEIDFSLEEQKVLWLRGGFPSSYLAKDDEESYIFRQNFIQTYLERDIPQFGPRIPSETLSRFWTMLAHNHGGLFNSSKLASNLSVSSPTVSKYLDLLVDLLLVRKLQPYCNNLGKRQVKAPKVYIRDSGILHALLGLESYNDLSGHPIVGSSFEGFVIENILLATPNRTKASFYRTSAGAEIDLILELPKNQGIWAIEIKLGLAPKPSKGFYNAVKDLKPQKTFIVYSGETSYPINDKIEVISLSNLIKKLRDI
ncbi:MAG TPA: ATP-binding protein [Candidatus Megaira endosymbiont of Nemacystus decipiens]|nr:ATP-binding protein [Candidatus Megaera endosymbiont of Nemacystus decipiens]